MTLILALDTTSSFCGAALVTDDEIIASRSEAMSKGQAERLFPMTDEVLEEAGLDFADLDGISVATGPGNFTGVRICVSAARGMSNSLKIPAVGVTALEALAYRQTGPLLATLDARDNKFYAQFFDEAMTPQPAALLSRTDLQQYRSSVAQCRGFAAKDLAEELCASSFEETIPSAHVYGKVALTSDIRSWERPSPVYMRKPDAALPTEPIPHLIS